MQNLSGFSCLVTNPASINFAAYSIYNMIVENKMGWVDLGVLFKIRGIYYTHPYAW